MIKLPVERIKALCSSNKLCITSELALLDLFEKYLKKRDDLPLLPEEDPSRDWSHLNETEKEAR